MKWEKVKLGEVCEIIAGQSPPSDTYNSVCDGLPFFQGKTDFSETFPVTRIYCNKPQKIAITNDILLSVRAPVGPTNIADRECCIGRGLSAIRAKKSTDYKFIYYFFKYYEHILSNKGSGSTFSAITQSEIRSIEIPRPPLETQHHIASILDKADNLRRLNKQLIAKYNELVQAVFFEMFGDPVKNEKGWQKLCGEKYCDKLTVGVVIRPASYYVEAGVTALRSLNIKPNRINLDDIVYFSEESHYNVLSKSILKEDDLVVVRTGSTGTAAVIPKELDGCNCIDLIILRPLKNIVNSHYLSFFFNSDWGKKLVSRKEVGGIQKHFNIGAIKKLLIPIPPVALQNEFASIVESIESQKSHARSALTQSEKLFEGLLDKCFKGEVVH